MIVRNFTGFLIGIAACMPAFGSLIYSGPVDITGTGFGNYPRLLTIHRTGDQRGPESGCVAVTAGGGISIGSHACLGIDAPIMGNGVRNEGGDEPPPLADNQKYGIPVLADVGIATAGQIRIIFNGTETAGDEANIVDLTMKLYTRNGVFISAVDGQQAFPATVTGNGATGYAFVLDALQRGIVDNLIAANGGATNIRVALEASLFSTHSGPESFLLAPMDITTQNVPEPSTALLGGAGMLIVLGSRFVKGRFTGRGK